MKISACILTALAAASVFASPVTIDEASVAARRWLSEHRYMDMNPGPITGVVESASLDPSLPRCYVALKENGGRLYVSPDTSFPPVMAFVQRHAGKSRAIPDMLRFDYEKMEAALQEPPATGTLLRASSPAWARRNAAAWRSLVSTNSMALKAVSGSASSYILPGFEYGGTITHWNQGTDERGVPLYNGYMVSESAGGIRGGLNLSLKNGYYKSTPSSQYTTYYEAAGFVPCGCVATAWSAVMQYMGVTGTVSTAQNMITAPLYARLYSPTDVYSEINWTATLTFKDLIPGAFDWSLLPLNFGGEAQSSSASGMSAAARELIARVAYNCGLLSDMAYSKGGSGATPSTPFSRIGDGSAITGFAGALYKSSWDYEAADSMIRSGRPVILSVRDSSGASSGHCVVGVGRSEKYGDYAYTYVFMGWSGRDDGWYSTDETVSIAGEYDKIRGMGYAGAYGGAHVPAYGKIGAANALVLLSVGTADNVVSATRSDDNGYFRTFYRSPLTGNFNQYVSVGGEVVLTNVSRHVSSSTSWDALKSGACGETSYGEGQVVGFDFVVDGDVSAAVRVADTVGLPLAVYSGNLDTGTVEDVSAPLAGLDAVRCYATSLDGGVDGEVFVLDPHGLSGNNPTNWAGKILSYWSFDDKFDNEKRAKSVRIVR